MKTDARDRFGTPPEKRFSRNEIELMMKSAGLRDIKFSNVSPFCTLWEERIIKNIIIC